LKSSFLVLCTLGIQYTDRERVIKYVILYIGIDFHTRLLRKHTLSALRYAYIITLVARFLFSYELNKFKSPNDRVVPVLN
jgi:hypothetical protein